MKPLDIVLATNGGVGLITVVSERGAASVEWINGFAGGKSAWWESDELKVIDSLPDLLGRDGMKYALLCAQTSQGRARGVER